MRRLQDAVPLTRALLFAGALGLAGCNVDASGVGSTASQAEAIVGSFEVEYSLSVGSGVSRFQIPDAAELRFGPTLVVIVKADGGGVALPVSLVRDLAWEAK